MQSDRQRQQRNPGWSKLRPFLRRDLRSRLLSAATAVFLCLSLSTLAVAILSGADSYEARTVRTALGLESPFQSCGSIDQPECTYDDQEQAKKEREFARLQAIRLSVLHELDLRLDSRQATIDEAQTRLNEDLVEESEHQEKLRALENTLLGPEKPSLGLPEPSYAQHHSSRADPLFSSLLHSAELSPLEKSDEAVLGYRGLLDWRPLLEGKSLELRQRFLDEQQEQLWRDRNEIASQRARETLPAPTPSSVIDFTPLSWGDEGPLGESQHALFQWSQRSPDQKMSRAFAHWAQAEPDLTAKAIAGDPEVWPGGLEYGERSPILVSSQRYRSPLALSQRASLLGTLLFGLSSLFFLLVGPVATATATARERENGTLPALRMTGLNAADLARSMAFGPNVFAHLSGLALLALSIPLLIFSGHLGSLLLPLGLLALLAFTTHLSAISLGDALGQRVNALIVGALALSLLLGTGIFGGLLSAFRVSDVGLLLGPLPIALSYAAGFSGIHSFGLLLDQPLDSLLLLSSIGAQLALAYFCLRSWRRRVESAWNPLFQPLEGWALSFISIAFSALALIELADRAQAHDFAALNFLTALSSVFLIPLLAWLVLSSLRRPARNQAAIDFEEARWAFLRAQVPLLVAAGFLGASYGLSMELFQLEDSRQQPMLATLAQVFLLVESGLGALLWFRRRREQKGRIAMVALFVFGLQAMTAAIVYGLEVQHVNDTAHFAWPLLANAEVSPFWYLLIALAWGCGLALVLTALLRERDAERAESDRSEEENRGDPDQGMHGRNLIH